MFELLQHKLIYSPVDPGAGNQAAVKKRNARQKNEEQATYIEELEKLNFELREARRAAFNLLEDAVQSKEALRVTEQKYRARLEQEVLDGTADLKRSQHQYVSLVENTPDLITRWNKYLKLVYANTAFADQVGARLKDLYGKTHLEMGQPDHIAIPYMNSLKKAFDTGETIEHFNSFPAPGGEVFYYSRIVPEKNEKGEIETVLSSARDITELKHSEMRVVELNRSLFAMNRELNALNAELKTFTTVGAASYAETLRHLYLSLEMIVTSDARNLSNSGRANLRIAQAAIQKMKLTTEDLVSFSKLHEVGAKEDHIDLDKILQATVNDFVHKTSYPPIEINWAQLPSINGYPFLLHLLFHHLLDNAIKFRKGDKDHVINITCRESGRDLDIEGAEKTINYYVISISDNGIGFPEEESKKIFEMFYQLHDRGKYKGSGTGLAICKKIMEMHGGFIIAESTPGEGSFFHCYFPEAHGKCEIIFLYSDACRVSNSQQ